MADVLQVFDELTAVTTKHRQKRVTDNVTQNNQVLRRMKERGNVSIYGGAEIVEPVGLVENSTITNIAGFQTAPTNYDNNVTAVRAPWVSKWMSVSAPGDLLRKNNGADALVKLVNAKVDIAEASAANYMNAEVCGDGSIDQSIFGLKLWIQQAASAAGTGGSGVGLAGGVDAGTYSHGANRSQTFSATAISDTTGLTARSDFNKLYLNLVFDMEKPDVVVATYDVYNVYEASIQQQMRYMDAKSADGGVESVMYKHMPVYFDANANFASAGQLAYMLNTKHLYMFEHPQARWEKEEARRPYNADAIIIPFLWMGNMICKSRRTQGILHG